MLEVQESYTLEKEKAMWKGALALVLGLLSFFVLTFVGESVGLFAAFASSTVYFFVCQFLLSRKNIDAYLKDWPIMLALDATSFAAVLIIVLAEKREVIMSQGPGLLLSTGLGTYAGAVVASLTARRMAARRETTRIPVLGS
jgi:hypothetical protein